MLYASVLEDLSRWARGSGLEIVLIVSGAILLTRVIHAVLRTALNQRMSAGESTPDGRNEAVVQAVNWLVSAVVLIAAGVLVAERLGLPLATLVPTATVAGVAVGFGAQRVVQDIMSGFFLLAEHQMAIGDWVTISPPGTVGGVGGNVEQITLRVTRLRTIEGEVVFVPNGEIRQVTNQSIGWARSVVDVPLRPEVDLALALSTLGQVGEDMRSDEVWGGRFIEGPDVLGVQALDVGVLQVRIVARVASSDQWEVGRELRRRIAVGLSDAGIEPLTPVVVPGATP